MRSMRRLLPALGAGLLFTLVLTTTAFGLEWTTPTRVTPVKGSQLSALHELASTSTALHLVHGRLGPEPRDDRLVYQRSTSGGRTWTAERAIFASTAANRFLIPNFAIVARGELVVVSWRARGPKGTSLFIRRSTDGGATWRSIQSLAFTSVQRAIGVPALSLAGDTVLASWTDRTNGRVMLRRSPDAGDTWGGARSLGQSHLSIDCDVQVLDGLVGLAADHDLAYLAWSDAASGACLSSALRIRTSRDGGRTWGPTRLASSQKTYGWPEIVARGERLLVSLQRPDGAFVVVRSANAGATFTERQFDPPGDKALGAADILMPRGTTAWLVYTDIDYRGDAVTSSRLRFRISTNSGVTWGAATPIVAPGDRLRQAANLVARGSKPVVVFQSGKVNGSTSDIFVVRAK